MRRRSLTALVLVTMAQACAEGGPGPEADASLDSSFDDAGRDAGAEDAGRDDGGADGGEAPHGEPWHALSLHRAGPNVLLGDGGHEFERIAISSEAAGSVHGVGAGEGVFYFELVSLVHDARQRFGVGPADMELEGDVGDFPGSLGVTGGGELVVDGGGPSAAFTPGAKVVGFVVDRRAAVPTVHVVAGAEGEGGAIVASRALDTAQGPLHAYVSGPRLTLGPQARFNAGYDTINHPFTYDPEAALAEVDPGAASELVLGFGRSESSPWHEPPSVAISGPATALPGEPVPLLVSAYDAEDGSLDRRLALEDDALPHSRRTIELEPGGIYRTEVLGRHRLRASVVDSGGKRSEAIHALDVLGAPPLEPEVGLVSTPGDGAILSEDRRGVRFTKVTKDGVRANQGLLDGYWYFEATRLAEPGNFGAGVVVQEGSLVPYALRAVPASMSVNFWSGIWHDIVWVAPQPDGGPHVTVGFAVDYRRDLEAGRDYPLVHVIIADVLAATVPIPDATTPVHPMLYGTVGSGEGPQLVANFGEGPFEYDPRAALAAAGHADAAELELGWGVHSRR